ncbi:MAG: hypothetical protein ACPLPR_00870 [Bacillota bacterium]
MEEDLIASEAGWAAEHGDALSMGLSPIMVAPGGAKRQDGTGGSQQGVIRWRRAKW